MLGRAEMRGKPRPEKQKADGDQGVEAANSPLSIVMLVRSAVLRWKKLYHGRAKVRVVLGTPYLGTYCLCQVRTAPFSDMSGCVPIGQSLPTWTPP